MLAFEGQQESFWLWPATFGGVALLVLIFWVFDRIMRRFFPSWGKSYTAAGNALIRVDTLFRPSRQYVIEAKEREEDESEESGDPPVAGDEGA